MGYFKNKAIDRESTQEDVATAIAGANNSITYLATVLPHVDHFIEAVEELRLTMEKVNDMYEAERDAMKDEVNEAWEGKALLASKEN
jgi:hypothetical protein